ncbi:MAG: zinc ribbon domain-containing protein [Gemmatimonadaceae bacterium]|nr:zinc ribbon domain-containing protein [Gemmatimonadaceae bacterium]
MDDLDRLFQRLVHSIRLRHAEYLTMPFTVQELYEDLVPYRHHRRDLGIETNQDYEAAVSRLLSGERSYLRGDLAMQEKLSANQKEKVPDTGAFRDYGASKVSLSPDALAALGLDPAPKQAAAAVDSADTKNTTIQEPPQASAESEVNPSALELGSVENCRFCGGTLPEGRAVTYCPHCGQNLAVRNCPACGTELDKNWRFCVTCGRSAA